MARLRMASGAMLAVLLASAAASAADLPQMMDAAKQAYQRGDLGQATKTLQAVIVDLQNRLGREIAQFMPPVPSGWQADPSEIQGLGAVGGGLSVTRAYTKGDSSLNASVILDSPAVEAAQAMIDNPAGQANVKRVQVDGEQALVRWDAESKSGDVTIVIAKRALLQIEGDSLSDGDVLVDMAKGFNIAGIRKLADIP